MSDKRDTGKDSADEAARGGSPRYGHQSGSGANEPKHNEKKEQAGRFVSRQGGDQTQGASERRT